MPLTPNPTYNSSLPTTNENQPYIFDDPNTVINPTTGQTAGNAASTLSADSLTPQIPFNVAPVNNIPFYPVAGLDATPPLTMTGPEQQSQDIINQIMALNTENTGQAAFQTQQETAQGIPELQKTQTDLSARLKALQNEALAIPMQLQQEATGRGITGGGLQPIQTAALRNNAIQALGISSLLEASRGNLTLAQDMVDRAVSQKFDPIKEQIAAKTANLNLIINSPAYSLADKNRAQAQLDIQNKKKADADTAAALMKDINAIAIEASKSGATPDVLNSIMSAKSLSEAIFYAGDSLGAAFKEAVKQQIFENTIKAEQLGIQKEELGLKKEDMVFSQKMQEAQLAISKAGLAISQGNLSLAWAKFKADETKGEPIKTEVVDNPTGTGKMLINSATGEVIRDYGVDPITGKALAPANALKTDALTSAQQLLDKFVNREGTAAVGGSRIFGTQLIPGSAAKNFEIQFDNVKSLLSLDNIKYLKGQGQVSDAERRLLADASTKLNLSQSEAEFKTTLEGIINGLSGATGILEEITVISPNGTVGTIPANQLQEALTQGYKQQ
jgi:hypothetical protein